MPLPWSFDYRVSPLLPPLSWLARIRGGSVTVDCGASVRCEADGYFDGTWVGEPRIEAVATSTTTFGCGIVASDKRLLIVPQAHLLEGVYLHRPASDSRPADLFISNSLAGLLVAAELELTPGTDYVDRFLRVADGLRASPIEIPTSGGSVELRLYENLEILRDGGIVVRAKPRERPFDSFADYAARLDAALASLLANAPGYDPAITLSNGYDSTAAAVVAARHGCRRALTFAAARPAQYDASDVGDSGESTAERLGMSTHHFDRLAYLRRADLPEAEFLATGMSGEDVANITMESELHRAALITGDVGAAVWRLGRTPTRDLRRIDISGTSMTEFRLRNDFMFIPLPVFAIAETPSLQRITASHEMRPWSIGGYYDRPIPRRIAEEGGIPRGSFATVKHAATALLHQGGEGALAPATAAAVRDFAASFGTGIDLSPRARLRRRERAVIRAAHALRLDRLARPLTRRQRALIHHDPGTGSILFMWAVRVVSRRYESLRSSVS